MRYNLREVLDAAAARLVGLTGMAQSAGSNVVMVADHCELVMENHTMGLAIMTDDKCIELAADDSLLEESE